MRLPPIVHFFSFPIDWLRENGRKQRRKAASSGPYCLSCLIFFSTQDPKSNLCCILLLSRIISVGIFLLFFFSLLTFSATKRGTEFMSHVIALNLEKNSSQSVVVLCGKKFNDKLKMGRGLNSLWVSFLIYLFIFSVSSGVVAGKSEEKKKIIVGLMILLI